MVEARIIHNPLILCGKPVIAGTRISVELVMENIHTGETIAEILSSYPHLSEEAVRAAIEFAGRTTPSSNAYPR